MNNIMFKAGEVDYSNRVVAENYKISSKPEYESWTDANGKEHRSKYRTRVGGTLEMKFLSISEYQTFIGVLNNLVSPSLTHSIQVWDNRKEQTVSIQAFIDFEPTRYKDPGNRDMVERIEITIREQ